MASIDASVSTARQRPDLTNIGFLDLAAATDMTTT
jgi:hypothetical protein